MTKRSAQPRRVVIDPEHPGRYSSSLTDGLAMLQCFTPDHAIRGIADLADDLGLGRSTTHRYATTLVALGYLEQGPSRKYGLSTRAADIGLSLLDSMPVRHVAREPLRALRAQTGHTVNLAVLGGSEIVYIDCWHGSRQGQYAIDVGIGPGVRRPVYCTAAGKALLARLPAAEQTELLAKLKLRRYGPNTITSKVALRSELEGIVTEGDIAVENEELLAGRRALAEAVLDGAGRPVAAVELAVPVAAHAVDEPVANFGHHVFDVAGRISAALWPKGNGQSSKITNNDPK